MRHIIEEARVILPGVQALFGFQTIAVFSERFAELANYAKACHVLGLATVVTAIAMVMTPAVYYRTCHGQANRRMARLSAWLIRGALLPLAGGLALDMFTVVHAVTEWLPLSLLSGAGTFALLIALWFVLPTHARRHVLARGRTP
ncbi:DUF6328 family protein [Massilia sp. Se16.2.3]|nr:DUF6328 family protein [Massilia sp. Se16.2.3]